MNILVDLFKTFFKIGMVTFGGGYAMIPIIETEVTEKHQWMKKEELLDLIAIAQSCPVSSPSTSALSSAISYIKEKEQRVRLWPLPCPRSSSS